MNLVHAGRAGVGREALHTDVGAPKQGSEELVKVSKKHAVLAVSEQFLTFKFAWRSGKIILLVRRRVISGHVLHERRGTASVQEVGLDTHLASLVGRGETTIEVGGQVDLDALVHAIGVQDTGNADTNVGLGVVTNDSGVDQEGQQGVLVLGSVLLEQCSGVVITDGLI